MCFVVHSNYCITIYHPSNPYKDFNVSAVTIYPPPFFVKFRVYIPYFASFPHPPKQYRNREESVSKQDRKRTNPNLVLLPRYTFAPSFKAKP